MAINIVNSLKSDEAATKVHFLPCNIEADAPASVDKYFEPFIIENEDGMTCSLRGFPLNGKAVDMPEGYMGYFLTESKRPLGENAERKFIVNHKFEKMVYWNWDSKPSRNDAVAKIVDWTEIAEEMHAPV